MGSIQRTTNFGVDHRTRRRQAMLKSFFNIFSPLTRSGIEPGTFARSSVQIGLLDGWSSGAIKHISILLRDILFKY